MKNFVKKIPDYEANIRKKMRSHSNYDATFETLDFIDDFVKKQQM